MGGRLVLAQIDSQGNKKSCKVSTSFLNKMNTLELLKENFFNNFTEKNRLFFKNSGSLHEHESYEKNNAMFAPYDYGILIFDFKNKKVFSMNNYCAFLGFGENNVKSDYKDVGHNRQENINIYHKNKIVKTISIFDENDFLFRTPRMINSCIKMGGRLFHNDKEIIINSTDDYFSLAKNIVDNYTEVDNDVEKELVFDIRKYSNMYIDLEGWDILRGDSTKEYLEVAFNFYKEMLTDKEKGLWLKETESHLQE